MATITTIGIDLAKQAFSTCEEDGSGRVRQRRYFRRAGFAAWLAQVPAGTVVAMEACSGAHHWARRCQAHGLQPKLIAAQFVTPFRKSRTAKNDRNDAEAIATAARQGNMRFVPIKSVEQQARLAWHRVREGYKTDALATSNRLRGLLAEFGVVMARNDPALLRALGDEAIRAGLPDTLLELLDQHAAHWRQLRERLAGQGARSSRQRAQEEPHERATPEQRWIRDLATRLPFGKVLAAIANKHARQLWAMLARDVHTVVRASTIRPTRPITEMQSGICCRKHTGAVAPQHCRSTSNTSKCLKAQGKSIMRPGLTGSSLRNC